MALAYLDDVENTADPGAVTQNNLEKIEPPLIRAVVVDATTLLTLALTDAWKWIRATNAAPVTVVVPPQVDVAWLAGTEIEIEQAGAGQVAIEGGAGVTINSSATLLTYGQWAVVKLKRVAADEWTLTGDRDIGS